MSTKQLLTEDLTVQAVNAAYWPSPREVRRRARRGLRPVEAALLARYRTHLTGNVLEIASRGDGLTEALNHHAASFTGIGFSTPEVELCRTRHPEATFDQRNFVDLDDFVDGEFDAVVAGRFALDHLNHQQRNDALQRIARVIGEEGMLILSSHNLAYESQVRSPVRQAVRRPWNAGVLGRALHNRSRLGRLQQRSFGYAILNDPAHAYGQLSYYVSPERQGHDLEKTALELLECVDRSDRLVSSSRQDHREPELHFVAQLSR